MRGLLVTVAALLVLVPGASAADHAVQTEAPFAFTPNDLTIAEGDTVTVSNPSGGFHTVVFEDTATECGTPSTTWTCGPHLYDEPGTYMFHCGIHTTLMTATVHVPAPVYTWVGPAAGSWTTAANWSGGPGGTYPGDHSSLDEVVISGDAQPVLDSDLTIGRLSLSNGGGRGGTGKLTVTGGNITWGAAKLTGGVTSLGAGTTITTSAIALSNGAQLELGGATTLGASLTGTGTLTNKGTMRINGNLQIPSYIQQAGATLTDHISSASAFGSLQTTTATLAGTLALDSAGFTPALTDVFDVVTGTITDSFGSVTGTDRGDRTYVAAQDAAKVRLTVAAKATPTPTPTITPTPDATVEQTPGPDVTTGPTPAATAATSTPTPSATTTPPIPPPPRRVAIGRLAKLPKGTTCASRKRFKLRLLKPAGIDVQSAEVLVNELARAERFRVPATVVLRKLPRKRFTLAVVMHGKDLSKLTAKRTYRACKRR